MKSREPFWTAANILTLSRIPLAGLVWLSPASPVWLLGVMFVSALTDVFDGRVARRAARKRLPPGSNLPVFPAGAGAWLDPLCDKIFVLSSLSAVWLVYGAPAWLVVWLAAREILLAGVATAYRSSHRLRRKLLFDPRAAVVGKLATVLQFAAVGAIVFRSSWAISVGLLAGAVGVAAAIYYVHRAGIAARASEP